MSPQGIAPPRGAGRLNLLDLIFERARRSDQTRLIARELGLPCQAPRIVIVRSFEEEVRPFTRTSELFCAIYFNHTEALRESFQQISIARGIAGEEFFTNLVFGLYTYAAKYYGDGYRLIQTKRLTSEQLSFFYQLGEVYLRSEEFSPVTVGIAERMMSVGLDRSSFLQLFFANHRLTHLLTILKFLPKDSLFLDLVLNPTQTDLIETLCQWGELLEKAKVAIGQQKAKELGSIMKNILQSDKTIIFATSEEIGSHKIDLKTIFQDMVLDEAEAAFSVLLNLAEAIKISLDMKQRQWTIFYYNYVKGLTSQAAHRSGLNLVDLYTKSYLLGSGRTRERVVVTLRDIVADDISQIMIALETLPSAWIQVLARLGAFFGYRTRTAAILSLMPGLHQSIQLAKQEEALLIYFAEKSIAPELYSRSIPEQVAAICSNDQIARLIIQRAHQLRESRSQNLATIIRDNIRQLVQEAPRSPRLTLLLAIKLWQLSNLLSRGQESEAATLAKSLSGYTSLAALPRELPELPRPDDNQ